VPIFIGRGAPFISFYRSAIAALWSRFANFTRDEFSKFVIAASGKPPGVAAAQASATYAARAAVTGCQTILSRSGTIEGASSRS
jgi:hypothetical protein